MSTQIAKQISTRMKAKNLTVWALEKKAGLRVGSVRNILRGNSKKPSAELLQAIADALGCTVQDLLQDQHIPEGDERGREVFLESEYQNAELLLATTTCVNAKLRQHAPHITVKQALVCIEEIYLHSLQHGGKKVDEVFADWFIGLVVDQD